MYLKSLKSAFYETRFILDKKGFFAEGQTCQRGKRIFIFYAKWKSSLNLVKIYHEIFSMFKLEWR